MHEQSPTGLKSPRRSSRETSMVERCCPMHTKDHTKPRIVRMMMCEKRICAGLYCATAPCTGWMTFPYTRDNTARVLDVNESACNAATVSGDDRSSAASARAAGSAAAFALSTRDGRARWIGKAAAERRKATGN